jgi:hypothetical protein
LAKEDFSLCGNCGMGVVRKADLKNKERDGNESSKGQLNSPS